MTEERVFEPPTVPRVSSGSARTRDIRGRYTTKRTPAVSLMIIREVLIAAAEVHEKPPEDVSQNEFKAARAAVHATYGQVPSAHAFCDELRVDDAPFPWRDLKAAALSDVAPERLYEFRHRANVVPASAAHALAGVRWMQDRLEKAWFAGDEYSRARDEAIAQLGQALSARLATLAQIQGLFDGGLPTALRQLGADLPTEVRSRPGGLSIAEALAFFYARKGYLASSYRSLLEFAQEHRFALESHKARPWSESLRLGRLAIKRQFGVEGVAREAPPSWDVIAWTPDHLPARRRARWERAEVMEWIERYVDYLDGATSTRAKYKAFQSRFPQAPSVNALGTHGGLARLVSEIARKGWQERAAAHDANVPAELTPGERAGRKLDSIRRWAAEYGPYREMLTLIQNGRSTTTELANATGRSPTAIRARLRLLRGAELVEAMEPLQSHLQRYALTASGEALLLQAPTGGSDEHVGG